MKTLRPGEIAVYCDVHHRTVSRWIASGQLKGFKLPGRGNYRVLLPDFLDFLARQQMPVPADLMAATGSQAEMAGHVLVIDDDAGIRAAIRRVLLSQHYRCSEAADGFQAGLLLSRDKPDLITLDLSMPGLDGFEVLTYLRQQPEFASLKVLVISGLGNTDLAKALALGADAVLSKPFDNSRLMELIRQLMAT